MPTKPDAIRKGRKFDQVVNGAREVFLKDGFEGASVDDIAKAANVSKATLYSYFPDKQILFLEVCRQQCAEQAEAALDLSNCDMTIEEILLIAARTLVGFIVSPFAQNITRIAIAEADRFPEFAREFYKSGPGLAHDRLVDILSEAVLRRRLVIDDIGLAAHQFLVLCKSELWAQVHYKIIDVPDDAQIERIVQSTVQMFLARYGVKAAEVTESA
ncbi:TetR/AcrR family transcriptional regulator [Cochlodiniinecator piscidefendens]|uniref:TetR/AcrR family transcriptional regulator n=1 Tax=Cochlodiniinecator piscidefendens TaxID=2715756 RepID=UPI00140C20B8|nr:TetR/AcrR family transcriptional regulator [Cochlodiniinecator piscidefendens]